MSFVNSRSQLKRQLIVVSAFGAFLFAVELLNIFSARGLLDYGLVPRTLDSLPHIFSSVFIHGSIQHFFSNIVALCGLAFLLLQYGEKRFLQVTGILIVLIGLMVWLFARSAIHVGASGLVYGYFGYLLLAGLLGRSFRLFGISIALALLYGSMVFGIFPSRGFVSWESHLFGFISGLALAYVFRDKTPAKSSGVRSTLDR